MSAEPLSQVSLLPALTVTTLNLNGLRSARRKGLEDWLTRHAPDVLLLQEVRAPAMPEVLEALGYHSAWHPAQKAGYSGVAIASRLPLQDVRLGMGHEAMDAEGRLISAQVAGVRFASVYLPSGSSGEVRQSFKDRLLLDYQIWTDRQRTQGPLVIGGDYNIAHQPIDLKNWRSNQNNSGFLPHEREWMTAHLASGLSDSHRLHLGERAEYTWWSNRGQAYTNDTGWRIDYLLTSQVQTADVWVDRPARLSDHAPLTARVILPVK
ncbi:exodeoxyribonuclease III Xth [Deinococcus proteolyticus MRP]|uniref:Exodeoxyribonuclease III Xth n=1 Tax=Deinococcus proteolyticus (strain ATCC 35074 / DSM 20540 / JCM 6276 / NBRC 101906 / NCIMB 13154 / VKM Ac-1939 / CCM 2703 / MRP) TaxID=693977 RepID=F0RM19_DEIPM|nr:exodeoxyribonuclease III [Deinococcus proteolyticus]ADY25939.1 exodeoxyribonuclease III Xth [Deinococcus proteolyticus MRP]